MEIILDIQYQSIISLPLSEKNLERLPGASWINIFYEWAENNHVKILLSGQIDKSRAVGGIYMISEMYTENTEDLVKRGAIPFLIYSLESPNISKYFYSTYTTKYKFKYTYLFPGAFGFFGHSNNDISLFWPNSTFLSKQYSPTKDIFLGMIASNKQMFNRRFKFIPGFIEHLFKKTVWFSYYQKLNKKKYLDLYKNRLEAAIYFSKYDDFALFGRGWNTKNTLNSEVFNQIQKINPLEIDDKFETLSRMKFSICFENFRFPGYITEKIFDCFFTGTIPIYLGAPDIENYVPSNCFIDAGQFTNFSDLNNFIRSISSEKIKELQENAAKFLNSPSYGKFTDQHFANQILNLIK
ncbi:glycosyltransferase family 10 [Pedobacter sp. PF22-3]|uniref:glycosyltransferase family 10 domain-containing protein n=1 Tax=Pedobacter sp. PF22-3 TaxID=2994467 RepID=UPI002245C7AA|nr:glycosyltransferase family 10 [Pedobacter sp. PF22-3]MCX2494154.1 glycosyltransferase family 10 [Pedobacter sp. PF22-3]